MAPTAPPTAASTMTASYELTDWNSELCDCCNDPKSGCYGFCCCPCLACSVSEKFGEDRCLPLCDICSPAVFTTCGCPCCAPPVALALRVGIRQRYNIKGSICKDITYSCFCMWCSWCQMHRELKHRNNNTVAINMQPAPMMMAPVMVAPVHQPAVIVASY